MATKTRNSNIELLRIFAILGVIILHFNTLGGGFDAVSKNSLNYAILMAMECLFIPAVNVFVIISGYFMCNSSTINLLKPIKLIFQVVLYNVSLYLLSTIVGITEYSTKELLIKFLPVNYFVILYTALCILSPFINLLIENMSQKIFSKFLVIIVIIFSIWPFLTDILSEVLNDKLSGLSSIGVDGSQNGYTIINFIMMYMIGAYIKRYIDIANKKIWIAGFFVSWICLVCGSYIFNIFGMSTSILYSYCNPIIICEAICIFMIFRNFKMKNNKVVNSLARATFTVFLLHSYILIIIREFIVDVCNLNAGLLLILILFGSIAIYLVCWVVFVIYEFFEKNIFRVFDKYKDKFDINVNI